MHLDWELLSATTGEGARLGLDLGISGVDRLTFFPARSSEIYLVGETLVLGEKEHRLGLEFEWLPEGADERPKVRGVLRVERGLELSFYAIDLSGELALAGG